MNPETLSTSEQSQLAVLLLKMQSTGAAPAKKPKKARKPETVKYLTEPELERFFQVIKSPRDRAMFMLAYKRGLRASEIGGLQLSDWLVRDDRLIVRRLKGSNGGEYHLSKSEVTALKAWVRIRGTEPGPLFLSREDNGISRQMLDVLMKKYGALAGLPRDKCHTHSLKHTCGTHLLNRGESLEDVQDHLGHRSIKSTEQYAKFSNARRHQRDKRLRDW